VATWIVERIPEELLGMVEAALARRRHAARRAEEGNGQG
jgi:hypothetical protein